jgi:tetrapyrrole methylase family protein/MazG family protein
MNKMQNTCLQLIRTVQELRGENGCPWDRRQSGTSLLKYLHSEYEELVEAIQKDDFVNICEELGDILYNIVMISQIHEERGHFTTEQVVASINEKLIRRHPHVFAGERYENEDQLTAQWQAIKAEEKKKKSI